MRRLHRGVSTRARLPTYAATSKADGQCFPGPPASVSTPLVSLIALDLPMLGLRRLEFICCDVAAVAVAITVAIDIAGAIAIAVLAIAVVAVAVVAVVAIAVAVTVAVCGIV